MIKALQEISAVMEGFSNKSTDTIRSYLILTEILRILSNHKIINYSSFLHLQWKCDFQVMHATLKDVTKKQIMEVIAENYNISYESVNKAVYKK